MGTAAICIRPSSYQTSNPREKSSLSVYAAHSGSASPKFTVSPVKKILYWSAEITDFLLCGFQLYDYIMSCAKCALSQVSVHNVSYLNSTKFVRAELYSSNSIPRNPVSSTQLPIFMKLGETWKLANHNPAAKFSWTSSAGLNVIWETKGKQEDLLTEVPTYA